LIHLKTTTKPTRYKATSVGQKEILVTRSNLLPWYIGLAIIVVADAVALLLTDEGSAEFFQQTALVVIPVVALGLMYLVFKSQK
jgi:hypothetical protein